MPCAEPMLAKPLGHRVPHGAPGVDVEKSAADRFPGFLERPVDALLLGLGAQLDDVFHPQHEGVIAETGERVPQAFGFLQRRGDRGAVGRRGRIERQPFGPLHLEIAGQPRGQSIIGPQINFDPSMGVALPHLVIAAHRIPLAAAKSDGHAGRNALAAQHHDQGPGEILAVPLGMLDDEIFHRVQQGRTIGRLDAVTEFSRSAQVLAERAGHAIAVGRIDARGGHDLVGFFSQPGQRIEPGVVGRRHLQEQLFFPLAQRRAWRE